jgi:predicted PurR-regulated permease PerM
MKRLAWYTVVILFTLGVLALLWQFRLGLALFLFSLAIAAVVRPVIDRLARRGIPHGLAILLAYLFSLLLVILPIWLAGGAFGRELQQVTDSFASTYNWFKATGENGSEFQRMLAARLPPIDALYEGIAGERGAALVENILGVASGLFGFLSNSVIALVLSIYWSADRIHFERLWLSLLPAGQRTRARQIWRDIETGVGSYIRSELVQSLLAAILLGLIYWALGLEYPTLLAIIGALAWLIPWVGAVLALAPAFLVGYAVSLPLGIAAAVVTLLVLVVLETVVEPRLFNRRRFSSLLIVIVLIAMADAFGLAGVLFAPPLAAAIQIFFRHVLSQPSVEPLADPALQIANLKMRLEQVREMTAGLEEPTPHLESMTDRLEKLVKEAEEAVAAKPVGESL